MTRGFALACLLAAGTAGAADLPKIKETELFTKTVSGCKDVKMEGWNHPTKQVLIERGVKLEKVSLCNNKKFPIFYAGVPYDPNFAHNNNYFFPLYSAMLKANGQSQFAIVATSDNTIILVTGNSNSVHESLEMYAD
jgi:hypothetical protein